MSELSSLLTVGDQVKITDTMTRVGNLSREVERMVSEIVDNICEDLNSYMRQIDSLLINQEEPITDKQLDDFTLNLPSLLYFLQDRIESLAIQEDVAKAVRQEVYNTVREKAQGTVADKDAAAELQSQAEAVVAIVYARSKKKAQARADAAYEMLNSIKKVMTRRIAEYELVNKDKGV
jgi:hypothetical protein